MEIEPGALWLPRSVHYAFGEPVVELVRLERTPPAFLSDLDLADPLESLRLPLADIELPAGNANACPDGFVFHMPRSGSTLFARMLTVRAGSFCLVELSAINSLLSHSAAPPSPDPDWLRRLLHIYRVALGPGALRLFVKTSSWMALHLPLFREACPAAAACFIYRDPVEVMVQIMERHPGWMARDARFLLGHVVDPVEDASDEGYCAAVLSTMCTAVAEAGAGLQLLAYDALAETAPRVIADSFGVALDAADRERMRELSARDSDDWSGRLPFQPDGAALRARAALRIERLAGDAVEPAVRRMLKALSPAT